MLALPDALKHAVEMGESSLRRGESGCDAIDLCPAILACDMWFGDPLRLLNGKG